MKKNIRYLIVAVLLLACSGCFPIFVPEEGGHRGGEHEHHDQGEHGGHH